MKKFNVLKIILAASAFLLLGAISIAAPGMSGLGMASVGPRFAALSLGSIPGLEGEWWLLALLGVLAVLLVVAIILMLVSASKKNRQAEDEPEEEPEEAPVEEVAEEEPEEASVEEATEEEPEEAPAEEPVEEEAVEEAPAEEPVEEEPVEEAPAEEATEEEPEEAPAEVTEEAAPVEEAPEEAPVEEAAEEIPEEEEIEEPEGDEDGSIPIMPVAGDGETTVVLNKSFMARLSQADEMLKARYSAIKNYILSFKQVKARISWGFDSFNSGRIRLIRIQCKGKNLLMYMALKPDSVDPKYRCKDVGNVSRYEEVPTMIKIKSDRSLKYAKELVDQLMAENSLQRNEKYEDVDYTVPYMETEDLIANGLIKTRETVAKPFYQ